MAKRTDNSAAISGYIVGPNASYVNKGISYGPGATIPAEIFTDKKFFEAEVSAGKIIPVSAEAASSGNADTGSGNAGGDSGQSGSSGDSTGSGTTGSGNGTGEPDKGSTGTEGQK
jgi:hypothetical protein